MKRALCHRGDPQAMYGSLSVSDSVCALLPEPTAASPSPLAGPLNWVLMGSRAMFPTSLVSGIIRLEWYA